MKKRQEQAIGDLLSGALNRAGVARQVAAAVVVQAADATLEELFGEGILEHARGHTFIKGELTLVCRHAALSVEVKQRKDELFSGISSRVPSVTVKGLRITHKASTSRGAAWYDGV